jgi:hypothetical protein
MGLIGILLNGNFPRIYHDFSAHCEGKRGNDDDQLWQRTASQSSARSRVARTAQRLRHPGLHRTRWRAPGPHAATPMRTSRVGRNQPRSRGQREEPFENQPPDLLLPSASFIVNGTTPAHDPALVSASAELRLANGAALLAKFDGEFAAHSSTCPDTGTVRLCVVLRWQRPCLGRSTASPDPRFAPREDGRSMRGRDGGRRQLSTSWGTISGWTLAGGGLSRALEGGR